MVVVGLVGNGSLVFPLLGIGFSFVVSFKRAGSFHRVGGGGCLVYADVGCTTF